MEGKKKMLATLVGCNYAGTPHELRGCINDVLAMRHVLLTRLGFAPADVTVLTDDDRSAAAVLPTGANVKRALADMVARAEPGDVLFFHYSGHGTLVPPVKPHHRGRDEAIVPCDFNLITDVDFRQLVDRVPQGASFTMVSDSCHSGGLIDREKEQIGPSVDLPLGSSTPASQRRTARRFLPYAAVLDHLSGASGIDASHHVADHLLALFGGDASPKFHQHRHDSAPPPTPRPDAGILLSGCQTDETSADVAEDDEAAAEGGKACGAFSNAVQAVLAAHPAPLSNREVVSRARKVLREQGFEQHPCLYCSDANADAPFLCQPEEPAAMAVL
ncbi:metacaspase-9 [Phragmites australis]|uniref:metacaspase-9 n=1 Tax=Phragmites australis TaxID=29695 RepID=UPI002D793AD7|nr:metacaspase-9 [Phragmites australis]